MIETSLIRSSLYLYFRFLAVALGGWLFWLVVSKLTLPEEVGYASAIISLVTLTNSVFSLGLEFSLLRDSSKEGVYLTATIFEIVVLASLSPVIVLIGEVIYGPAYASFMVLGAVLLVTSGLQLTGMHSALGLLRSRAVLASTIVGLIARFVVGVALVLVGLGALGILSGMIAQALVVGTALAWLSLRSARFNLLALSELKALIKHGLGNLPTKAAQLTALNLSVVLMAALTNPTAVGMYYIALMISLVAGGLATSLATMSIPSSALGGADTSVFSLRYGLGLTAPIISILLVGPSLILSMIGEAYVTASAQLQVLALSIVPWAIVLNAVAMFNYKRSMRTLVIIGSVQLLSLLISFLILVPVHGGLGAAVSVFLSSLVASIPLLYCLGKGTARPTFVSISAIAAGYAIGLLISQISGILGICAAFSTSLAVVMLSKVVTPKELVRLVGIFIKK